MSVFAILAGLIFCGLSLWRGFRGELFMGRAHGGDFLVFYSAGKMASPAVYDRAQISAVEHGLLPEWTRNQMLPFGNPPWFAQLLRLVALVPYRIAYGLWLLVSLAIYIAGLRLLFPVAGLEGAGRTTATLLAVSAFPFLFETWIGGQVSVLAFFGFAAFLRLRHSGRFFMAGLALALSSYKPSLVALPAVMLVALAEWPACAGFAVGIAALLGFSAATFGTAGMAAWIDSMDYIASLATYAVSGSLRNKCIDMNAFFTGALGPSGWSTTLAATAALLLAVAVLLEGWQLRHAPRESRDLALSGAIATMLVASVYSPIYDAAILPAALLLAWPAVQKAEKPARETFLLFLAGLYVLSAVTQLSAEYLHLQLLTPLMATYAWWSIRQARRVLHVQVANV